MADVDHLAGLPRSASVSISARETPPATSITLSIDVPPVDTGQHVNWLIGSRQDGRNFKTKDADMTDVKTFHIGDMAVHASGTGSPLMLLHGFTTTSEFWREQVAAFSRTHLVIRPNLPGHGISSSPANRTYTLDAFVEDLEQVFQYFSISEAALVGLSMGGVIAQKFALKHPNLLRALVLADTTPHGLGSDVQLENVLSAIDSLGVATVNRNVVTRSFGAGASRDLVEWARGEVIQTPDFVARQAIASLNDVDTRTSLKEIITPTLVIVGAEDIITPPAESRILAEGIPDSRLIVIENAGHFPMLEQPADFNRALRDFLDQYIISSKEQNE